MKQLIKVEDIGCGTRRKHYCYINIPEEYIKQDNPCSNIVDLTKEGHEYLENNIPYEPHGYLSFKIVTNEDRDSIIEAHEEKISKLQIELDSIIEVYEEKISKLHFELNELKMN
jgi:hypothetical protein